MDDKKLKRGPNFSAAERNLLLHIIKENKDVIENKKTDSKSIRRKEEAWVKIAEIFNMNSISVHRNVEQLHNFYENYKRRTKKAAAEDKVEIYRTGGGTFKRKLNEEGEKFMELLKPQFLPLSNSGDSDARYHIEESDFPHDTLLQEDETCIETEEVPFEEENCLEDAIIIIETEKSATPESKNLKTNIDVAAPSCSNNNDNNNYCNIGSTQSLKKKVNDSTSGLNYLKRVSASKININDLKIHHLNEKHELEMSILHKELEIKETELKIKKAALQIKEAELEIIKNNKQNQELNIKIKDTNKTQ